MLRVPLIETLRATRGTSWRADLVAGATTAVMLVPQGMAYALLAGLDPVVGLYASTVPLVLYALFGSSRALAVGPVAMVSLLVAAGVGPLAAGDPARAAVLAAALAAMVGVMQLGMGLARLGFLVRFLSHPVIAGFTSAAALIIGASQLKHLLGVELPRSHHVHEILLEAARSLPEISPPTIAIGVASLVALVVLKRLAPRVPRFLLVVLGATVAVQLGGLEAEGVAVVGQVPSGLPRPSLPWVDLGALRDLLPIAVTISLVGFLESISVAKHFARADGVTIDADQELKGLGLANLGSAAVGGYPVTGGFSRTAVNAGSGAATPLAGLVTGVLVALVLVLFTSWLYSVPKAVLAAIILSAVGGLVDVREARHLWRISRADLGLMALTFVGTLSLGIEAGIGVGVAASVLRFVWQSSRPHVAELGRLAGTTVYRNLLREPTATRRPGVLTLRIDAPLYFANTAFLTEQLAAFQGARPDTVHTLVIDAHAIGSIDAAGDAWLHELQARCQASGVRLVLAGLRGPVRDVLERSGLVAELGPSSLPRTVHEAVGDAADLREVG